ncbi:UDP-glucose/GDP-mannose dehydrogenase family protein [Candidatus Gottesmanbacteria bacterium]|nr:UDP-glucose/GDP-mannose dehydrogenase family protein [Candidatus Gottesmanbacteria bacterium]
MTIAVVGHGYVGLVTAAVFADLGNVVWVIGHTKKKIENLQKGIIPFFEPGLSEMVKHNLAAYRLIFTKNLNQGIQDAKIIFICVGTPPKKNGEADLSSVFEVAKQIGKNLHHYALIVTKSTVPVGTNRKIAQIVKQSADKNISFDVASCPEFLKEGTAISDTLCPDRIVFGVDNKSAAELLCDLHKHINGERIVTAIETAEMIKYASNALLATKISFANAIAFICEHVAADAEEVLEGVGLDKRLGRNFLYPGVGFGGSCLPKDIKALVAIAKYHGYNFELLRTVDKINQEVKTRFVDKIVAGLGEVKGKIIAVLGLSFKPNTDDIREAPAIEIITRLQQKGAKIKAFDPVAMGKATNVLKNVVYCKNPLEAASAADSLLILTEWNEFKQLDLSAIKKVMKQAYIFDGRNIYDPNKVKKLGFIYTGVGRK